MLTTTTDQRDDLLANVLSEENLHWFQERVLQLERELEVNRTLEERTRAALEETEQQLEAANARIARQQAKLKLLVEALRQHQISPAVEVTRTATPLRDTDLAAAGHAYRQLLRDFSAAPTPALRQNVTNTAVSNWAYALWQNIPRWTKGIISGEDASFLATVIDSQRPGIVHEIGTASGSSSALVLAAMAKYADPAHTWLHSHDIAAQCYFDPTYAVGDATREMVPALLEHWQLHIPSTALDLGRHAIAGRRPLYFIDANHCHPWPALDLIALLPLLQPGDTIVLHDINLPAKTAGKFPDHGAQWLMEGWRGPRLVPDVEVPNIGAITFPDDPRLVLASLVNILAHPWEEKLATAPEQSHLHACEQALADYLRRHRLLA